MDRAPAVAEKLCARFTVRNGDQVMLDVRAPIVDWSEHGLLHVRRNGNQVTVLWDDQPAVHRALAEAKLPDSWCFTARREIARINRESREALEVPGRTHYVTEKSCPVVPLAPREVVP